QTEKLCQTTDKPADKKASAKPAKDANLPALEYELSNLLGLKVEIDFKMSGGKVMVSYETLEQLDDILHRLSGGKHDQSISSDTDEIPLVSDADTAGRADLELVADEVSIIPDNVDDAIAELEAGALLDDGDNTNETEGEIDLSDDFTLSDDDSSSLIEDLPPAD
ncbi:MAG: hypothetical protein QGH63_11020, partial [Rhodospirillales bacterium]|nr:hypothetical protein [Rhodospirillales bacterium]